MKNPYTFHEQQASLVIGQAIALQSFSFTCQLLGLDPVKQLDAIAKSIKASGVERCSHCDAEATAAAYDKVLADLKTFLVRERLLSQLALEEADKL